MMRVAILASILLLAGCSQAEAPAPTAPADAPWFQRLSNSPEAEISPRFSPDGTQLVYERAGSIRLLDVASRATRVLVPQGNHPSWTRDGSAVVFVRRDVASAGLIHRLMRVALSTGALDTLSADSVDAYEPAASPASAAIALRQLSRISRLQSLRVVDGGGTTLEVLAEAGTHVDTTPAWSRDGTSIAFVRIDESGAGRLMLVPSNGSRAPGVLDRRPATWWRIPHGCRGVASCTRGQGRSRGSSRWCPAARPGRGRRLRALSHALARRDAARLHDRSHRANRELWMLVDPKGIGDGPYRY
jgi:hypothetical protein